MFDNNIDEWLISVCVCVCVWVRARACVCEQASDTMNSGMSWSIYGQVTLKGIKHTVRVFKQVLK